MISARSTDSPGPGQRSRRTAWNTPPGGCIPIFGVAFASLSLTVAYGNPPYAAAGFPVTPPGFTRWGYAQAIIPSGVEPFALTTITLPIFPGQGGLGTTANAEERLVGTIPNAYKEFGQGGLAVQGDIGIFANVVAVEVLGEAYIRLVLVVRAVNTKWVDVRATGWTALDYGGTDPNATLAGQAVSRGGDLWSGAGERYNTCDTGYVITLTTGECTSGIRPTTLPAPGWVGEPTPASQATIVSSTVFGTASLYVV